MELFLEIKVQVWGPEPAESAGSESPSQVSPTSSRRYMWSVFCLALLPLGLVAQSTTYALIDSFSTQSVFFTVDRLQQLYEIDSSGILTKYAPEGNVQFTYSNQSLGDLALTDATDPFNVLLYYPEYQSVILLDRTLSPTAELNLLSLGLIDVQLMAMSNDQHIWMYDQATFKLYKIDPRGKINLESGDLSLMLAHPPLARQLIVQNNFVYLFAPEQGLFQFDSFGQYLRTIDLKPAGKVQLIDQKIFYLSNPQQLRIYDFVSFRESSLDLPAPLKNFHWQKGLLYGQSKEKIWVWVLKER